MRARKLVTRVVVLMLCVAALCACVQISAYERTLDCTYLKITGDGFVADTFNGVQARYNLYGRRLYCTELVERYFDEVFGLNVDCRGAGGPVVVGTEEYWFEKTEKPIPGDVLFGSARARGVGYNHWAICKEVDTENGTMTLFEQNWRWNGKAGVNRVISYENNCYVAYRLMNADGRVLSPAEKAAQAEAQAMVVQRQAVKDAKETILAQAESAAMSVM